MHCLDVIIWDTHIDPHSPNLGGVAKARYHSTSSCVYDLPTRYLGVVTGRVVVGGRVTCARDMRKDLHHSAYGHEPEVTDNLGTEPNALILPPPDSNSL